MDEQSIQDRSYQFACRVIRLVDHIVRKSLVTRTIARQLLSSATSVGANLEEASAAQSVSAQRLTPLIDEAGQIVGILTAIVKNATNSSNRGHSTSNIQH